MDKKISIIVPVYNVEKMLKKCIESICNQTYKRLEIILVDDGSSDRCPQLCDDLAEKDKRIKVIHKENGGAASARNSGLDIATGDYIAFVDSDDYIDYNMYEEMMKINEQYNCDIVMCDCYKENGKDKCVFTHNIRKGYYNKQMLLKEYFPTLLMTNTVDYPPTISNCVCLFKMNLLNNNNIRYKEGMRFSEDLLVGSQAMYYAKSFYYMKEQCYYHYMMNENSVTHTYYDNKWYLMRQLYDAINEFFGKVEEYDFQRQIDLSLLYIVYHCIGNVKKSGLSKKEIKDKILFILNDRDVRIMFSRLKINSLDVSWKLKIITFVYKYRIRDFLIVKN